MMEGVVVSLVKMVVVVVVVVVSIGGGRVRMKKPMVLIAKAPRMGPS